METFPAYATIMAASFQLDRQSAVERTDMESGPPKQLQKLSRVIETRKASILIKTAADYASFMTWFKTNINYGTDWFTFTDPIDATAKTGRFVNGLGSIMPLVANATWQIDSLIETWSG